MKSHDEIKKGLECCWGSRAETGLVDCGQCPYWGKYGCPAGKVELGNDALALIQQLEARVPRWISVEERLPETFRRVLCSDGERVFQAIYTTGSRYFPDHWEEVVCLEQNSCSTEHMHEPPTHWMPLPEPPKEE